MVKKERKQNRENTKARSNASEKTDAEASGISFADNRENAVAQRQLNESIDNSSENPFTNNQKVNRTGLPDSLKSGIESLSGYSMDDVRVHYNSSQPKSLNAHAFAQGSNIHLGPGQEKHLPHEAWHVVQQKQGRVKPTKQLKAKINLNDDRQLEKEADEMGARAQNRGMSEEADLKIATSDISFYQLVGLDKLSEPKIHKLEGKEFELQQDVLASLNKIVELLPEQQAVYRLGSIVLHPKDEGFDTEFIKPLLGAPKTVAEGYNIVSGNESIQGQIINTVLATMGSAGQLNYFKENSTIMDKSVIVVDVDFFYSRPKDAVGFHKDTIGHSLFVNLNFNNSEKITGPEYVLNPEPIPEHDEHIKDKLPEEFRKDIASERKRLPQPSEIKSTQIPEGGIVSFVDEMIHHTTPFLGNRDVPVSGEMIGQVVTKFGLLKLAPNKLSEKSKDVLRDAMSQPDKLFKRDDFSAKEIHISYINFIFEKAGSKKLDTVAMAGCNDDCPIDLHIKSHPITKGKALSRQMSAEWKTAPRGKQGEKRQFFRTWVQTIPISLYKEKRK